MDFIMMFSYSLLLLVLIPNTPSPPPALKLVPLLPTVVPLLHFCHTPSSALFFLSPLNSFCHTPTALFLIPWTTPHLLFQLKQFSFESTLNNQAFTGSVQCACTLALWWKEHGHQNWTTWLHIATLPPLYSTESDRLLPPASVSLSVKWEEWLLCLDALVSWMESAQHMQHRVEVYPCSRGRRSQETLVPSSHLLRVQAPLPALTHGAEEDKSGGERPFLCFWVWDSQDTLSSLGCVLGESWAV